MQVSHIVSTFPPYKGGMGNSASEIAKFLISEGINIQIITPDYSKKILKSGNAAIMPEIFLKLQKPDIIHLHYPFFGTQLFILIYKLFNQRVKLVTHYHMNPELTGFFKKIILNLNNYFFLPLLLKKSDAIIVSSLDYALENGLAKYQNKIHEIPFGVDTKKFFPRKTFIGNKTPIIMFTGGLDRAHYFKGLNILLNACAEINKQNIDFKLKIIGDGDLKEEYTKNVKNLNIQDKTIFLGKLNDDQLTKEYQNCDCLILPSINRGEAFGIVLLEAMACGKPVIASRLPGVKSVFQDGQEGYYIKAGDINDLTEKIKNIIHNPQGAKKLGEAGIKLIQKKYTHEIVGEKIKKLYEDLLNT